MQLQAPHFPLLVLTGFWGNGGQVGDADLPYLGTEAVTASQSVRLPTCAQWPLLLLPTSVTQPCFGVQLLLDCFVI